MFSYKNALLLLVFLPACANIQTGAQDLTLQPYAPGIVIVSQPVGKGYYAVVEKINGRWRIIGDLSTQPIVRRSNDNQEILFVSHSLRSIAPVFDKRLNTHGAHCTPSIDKDKWYWLCTSQFSTIKVPETIGRNIVSCALTLCLAAGSRVELDHDKVQQAVIESGLIDMVKAKIDHPVRDHFSSGDFESESSLASSKQKQQQVHDDVDAQYQDLHRILDEAKADRDKR